MQSSRILITTAAVVLLDVATPLGSTAAADPPGPVANAASLAPPVVPSLSDETQSARSSRSSWTRRGIASSPGGQLAVTVVVIVFALFIAGLAPKRNK